MASPTMPNAAAVEEPEDNVAQIDSARIEHLRRATMDQECFYSRSEKPSSSIATLDDVIEVAVAELMSEP